MHKNFSTSKEILHITSTQDKSDKRINRVEQRIQRRLDSIDRKLEVLLRKNSP